MKQFKISLLSFALIAFTASCGSEITNDAATAPTDSSGMTTPSTTGTATNDLGMDSTDGGAVARGMRDGSDTTGAMPNTGMDTTRSLNTTGTNQSPDNNTNTNNPQGGGRR